MTITNAFGQCFFALFATSRMIGRFVATRSSRDWPGLARDAGGDDEDVGALEVGPVRGAA